MNRAWISCANMMAVWCLLSCVPGGEGGSWNESGWTAEEAALAPGPALQVVSTEIAPRVSPNGSLSVSITVKNTGKSAWLVGEVKLAFTGDAAAWPQADLALPEKTGANQTVTFSGSLRAMTQMGRHTLSWRAQQVAVAFGPAIEAKVELTCSDGVFCNGEERWVNGKCFPSASPCDDNDACTGDTCDETNLLCSHTLGANCNACFAKNCVPHCRGAVCGGDGCGGSCGPCGSGQACADGVCVTATAAGTCSNPIPILGPGESLFGLRSIRGDTTDGFNETVPSCNPTSPAPEKVYTFTVPAGVNVGIDARSSGYDTVLHVRKGDCLAANATVLCSDDASPPGNFGSRVAGMLGAGTYFLMVDGFDTVSFGPFDLYLNLVSSCVPQCDGKFCGEDGCGGSCGPCAAGQVCNTSGRCVASPCTPACNGRKCGDDGCGGSCGECDPGRLCVTETGACKAFPECDHELPTCKIACSSNQFCGTDCVCHDVRSPLGDVVISKERLQNDILFDWLEVSPTSCTVAEQCVGGTGLRRLLRFSVEAVNQGQSDLIVPPPAKRPDEFEFSACHGHYHFQGFASYALLDAADKPVLLGKKLAYCMEDSEQVHFGPSVSCVKRYNCDDQGISRGWSDLYGNALDCQWLDITGVPAGNYKLRVTVNPARAFQEHTFDNNTTVIPVTIPAP